MPGAIDVHCHVFNVADLPAKGFVVDVFLRGDLAGHSDLADIASFAVGLLSDVLQSCTADDRAERAFLAGQLDPADDPLTRANTRAIHLLAASMPGSALSASLPDGMRNDPARAAFSARLAETVRPDVASYLMGMTAETVVVVTPEDVLPSITPFGAKVSQYLSWAVQMTDFRSRNIERMFQLFGPERLGVSVIMPSLVDFHRWLGTRPGIDPGDAPVVSVDAQADLMTTIMRTRGDVLTFFPVDPLRPIQETMDALAKHFSPDSATGFVGVKMYPPLGFRASDNSHIADYYKDDPVAAATAKDVAALVDANLAQIFQFCAANDVPVMCHCNLSNETALGHAYQTARPVHWEPVVKANPSLRLNLGHFASVSKFASNPDDDDHQEIGKLFDQWRVYADVADETDASDPNFRVMFASALQRFTSSSAGRLQRILYGSDWDMLGVELAFETYLGNWVDTIDHATHQLSDAAFPDKFFRTNALDYLGLSDAKSVNRARIVQFFGGGGNAPDWLQKVPA